MSWRAVLLSACPGSDLCKQFCVGKFGTGLPVQALDNRCVQAALSTIVARSRLLNNNCHALLPLIHVTGELDALECRDSLKQID